jgi:UDP-glucose 4-epimerase
MSAPRPILVTGAAGFIGRRLCEALRTRGGSPVRALVRREVDGPWHERVVADITEGVPEDATRGVGVVYHLAARTHAVDERDEDEALYRRVNVEGTRSLLESARGAGVRRFVFVSSVKALGEGHDGPGAPTTAYGRTKLEAERLVIDGGYVAEPVVVRPALVYGPGVKGNLERMIQAIDAGRFPPPPRVSNRRSLVHVDDVVGALLRAGEEDAAVGRSFVVTDGHPYSTREMYELVCRALGRRVPAWGVPAGAFRALAGVGDALGAVTRRRAPFDSTAYEKLFASAWYDGTATGRELGYEPKRRLGEALTEIVAPYRQ